MPRLKLLTSKHPKEPGEFGTVGTGPLNPDGEHVTVQTHPLQEAAIAVGVVGNGAVARCRPMVSITAAWWKSVWVSTPPTTAI